MTAAGLWTIALALAYTAWLVLGGRIVTRRRETGRGGFFVGGRSFGPWTVAFCITGLFSGSSYIAIVELSYRTGVSAIWYGVAETVQVLLIALLLVKPLRERLVVTVTGIIGDRFGRAAKAVGSVITGLTFPMYSVATTIAFASALSVVTDLSLPLSVAVTAVVLLGFLSSGGMRSVGFSQTMNVVMIGLMFLVGLWALLAEPGLAGPGGLAAFAAERPEMFDPVNAGTSLIVAWFGTFIINVPLAQAAFQMSMSARTPADGQRGLLRAAVLGAPLLVLGVLVGVAAAIVTPGGALPLVSIAEYVTGTVPPWAAGVFFVGLWACALGWAGPCQFSGATSLGRDLGSALHPGATEAQLVRYTRVALVGLTVVMVAFALLRTEESAWWNVMAWTLRNGATLAPVLAAFAWPLATRSAALAAMLAGFGTGLAWYAASGFHPTAFLLGLHPVWLGMAVNLLAMTAVTLARSEWRLAAPGRRRQRGVTALAGAGVLVALAAVVWPWLTANGMTGLLLGAVALCLFSAAVLLTEGTGTRRAAGGAREDAGAVEPSSAAPSPGTAASAPPAA
ncbi:sodium:solute symporter family protein [Citricoccus sp. SGAir0253]|uniref:sodium:solute symporter family protein n=1 Tax=Citricoccus sp. SGAir0253 TaxID=2567881 RepID=UPI0010CCC17B|nr:sodium:solute symporter family protein [Citricoccus sp. SGAir0253]QCU79055.1 sodium:solute symporter family protein [Citricoccus sp. SGAir0253]